MKKNFTASECHSAICGVGCSVGEFILNCVEFYYDSWAGIILILKSRQNYLRLDCVFCVPSRQSVNSLVCSWAWACLRSENFEVANYDLGRVRSVWIWISLVDFAGEPATDLACGTGPQVHVLDLGAVLLACVSANFCFQNQRRWKLVSNYRLRVFVPVSQFFLDLSRIELVFHI